MKGRVRIVELLALLAMALVGAAHLIQHPAIAAAGAGVPTPDFSAIDRFVESEMEAQRIPGLALGIVQGDRVAHMRGFGTAGPSGGEVTGQTPFIIGSLSKSFTALAAMQLVEARKLDLDAPVQRYLTWFRVADERASARITVRHLLNQTSGLSTKTGRSFQGNDDTSEHALERAVRKLSAAELTEPVGMTHQYSTINYSVLGLVVQEVSGQSYEAYVQDHIFEPLTMRNSFTSQAEAQRHDLATGHHYWFGRPAAIDLPYNRGLLPAGYLISSAEDMTHYLIAQLNGGDYGRTAVLSSRGMAELHRPAAPTGASDTSYGMGWFIGPVNGIPAVHHQGETFNSHANMVLIPGGEWGVVVLINAENSLDLFTGRARMADIAEGAASLLVGRRPPPSPSSTAVWVVYGALFAVIALQVGAMIRSTLALRHGEVRSGRLGPRWHIGLSLVLNVAWALLVLVVLPLFVLGLPLLVLASGFPDLGYSLLISGVVALGWGILRTVWAYLVLRNRRRGGVARARSSPSYVRPPASSSS